MNKVEITIIVPMYGGEAFLTETLNSIKAQSFTNYEVLCIDDCSPDRCKDIVEDFAKNDGRFKYFRTPQNLGIVPKVLNFASTYVSGNYFVYSSQDDLFSPDWLDKMWSAITSKKADAAIPELEFYFPNREGNRRLSGIHGDITHEISGEEAFFLSLDWTIPGNALWKSSLLKKYGYFDFGMNADEYTVRYYFLRCSKVVFCDGVFYYRQNNPGAITKRVSPKSLDEPYNHFKVWQLINDETNSPYYRINYSTRVLASLIEKEILVLRNKSLKIHTPRLYGCIDGIRTRDFLSDLNISLKKHGKLSRPALMLAARSNLFRKIVCRFVILKRNLNSISFRSRG